MRLSLRANAPNQAKTRQTKSLQCQPGNPVLNNVQSTSIYPSLVSLCFLSSDMHALAHYAAMPDLNVWAGRTSNCFRGAFDGMPFGGVSIYVEGLLGEGGRASASGGKRSLAHGDGWYL